MSQFGVTKVCVTLLITSELSLPIIIMVRSHSLETRDSPYYVTSRIVDMFR